MVLDWSLEQSQSCGGSQEHTPESAVTTGEEKMVLVTSAPSEAIQNCGIQLSFMNQVFYLQA